MYNHMTSLLAAFATLAMVAPISGLSQTTSNKVTDVLVTLTVKPGVTRDQIVKVMHDEVSGTVRAYLDGKIRQWYSRADGKGVVFILNCASVEEAKATMEQLPLAKLNLMDYEYLPLSPLQPLGTLLGSPAPRQ
jgi:hypothetical protein